MNHLRDLPVLVLGLGASGLAMARWCARHSARVTVADTRTAPPQLAALQRDVPDACFIGGAFSAAMVEGGVVRAVYLSPGLSPDAVSVVVDAARSIGIPVGGELGLFARALADLREVVAEAAPAEAEQDNEEEARVPASDAAADAAVPTEASVVNASRLEEDKGVPLVADANDAEAGELTVESESESEMPAAAASGSTLAEHIDGDVIAVDDFAALPIAPPEPEPPGYRPAVLAVTGTNGKTTVVSLTGQLVERAGKTVAIAGNIGPTLLDTLAAHIDADTLPQVWVLELSSFQLDGVQDFEPTAATVLNLTQDHLDWHGSMQAYGAAKARVFGERGLMVLNREDPAVMDMLASASAALAERTAEAAPARRPSARSRLQRASLRSQVTFGGDMPQRPGDFGIESPNGMAWLVRALEADETRKRRRDDAEELHIQRLMPADALRIRGRHNAVNALAALALAQAAGCPLAPMLYGLREYRGEPHRVESVAVLDGVEYFDDSKGTNVGATVAALQGLGAERRIVAILGGDGKGQNFSPLAAPVAHHARAVVLIGRDAPLLRAALADTGVPMEDAATLPAAVDAARRRAHAGDAVLLSPACASFDMFDGYEHRARVFCEAVAALEDEPVSAMDEPAGAGESLP